MLRARDACVRVREPRELWVARTLVAANISSARCRRTRNSNISAQSRQPWFVNLKPGPAEKRDRRRRCGVASAFATKS